MFVVRGAWFIDQMPRLSLNQQCQSTEGSLLETYVIEYYFIFICNRSSDPGQHNLC